MSSESQAWTFNNLYIRDSNLPEIRKQIYHSRGPGYFILRQFFDPAQVTHLREVWSAPYAKRNFVPLSGKHQFQLGCPNYIQEDQKGNRSFFNFLWRDPFDELTYEATYIIQMLRNRISGKISSHELLPIQGKSVSYRVVLTRNHEAPVPPHRDTFWEPERPGLPKTQDMTRLQVTLMLSNYGMDYDGEGFALINNQNKKVIFGVDEPTEAGDLIFWRYANEHSVMNVRATDQQLGFLRIIYPQETILEGRSMGHLMLDSFKISQGRRFIARHIPSSWKKSIKTVLGLQQ